ncbi:MAG: hypothetical protein KIS79_04190 [Burkholderiales bacterium]|nr:hypothetical protein [Burkholderiales bacterium]
MSRIPAIALDFARPMAVTTRFAPVLLLIGALVAAAAFMHYRAVAGALQARNAQVSGLRELTQRTLPALSDGASASPEMREQIRKANEVLAQINVPWSGLFASIEAAQDEDVALLAVQPDVRTRSVAISGQARDMTSVLAYMTRLEHDARLREVILANHAVKVQEAGQPVEFTLAARWVESR